MALDIGSNLSIYERIRQTESEVKPRVRAFRERLNARLESGPIDPPNPNIDQGTVLGAGVSAALFALNDYLPADVDIGVSIVDVEFEDGNRLVTLDIDASQELIAEFFAKYEGGAGLTSLWADDFEIVEKEKVSTRIARDTYRVTVRVID